MIRVEKITELNKKLKKKTIKNTFIYMQVTLILKHVCMMLLKGIISKQSYLKSFSKWKINDKWVVILDASKSLR